MNRFERQIILPGFGTKGQEKLAQAKVLVVGVGGLGCPVLLYLSAMGVRTIGIVDGDSVSHSNLNRQILFGVNAIGKPKASTAAQILQEKYPDIRFHTHAFFLNSENTLDVLQNYDLVIDGSDNFETRYLLNDACVLLKKPLIMGAIYQYEGQVMVLNYGDSPINYRDLYPNPPSQQAIPNCNEAGVIGILPGVIGNFQAVEAIKIICEMGGVLNNKVRFYNLRSGDFYEVDVHPNPKYASLIPQTPEEFRKKTYHIPCSTIETIDWKNAIEWVEKNPELQFIDIRELEEMPVLKNPRVQRLPMSAIKKHPTTVQNFETLLLFCQSGIRSQSLGAALKQQFPEKKILTIENGINSSSFPWKVEILDH